MDNKMAKQAILNLLQTFKLQNKRTEYSEFYTTYTRETPIEDISLTSPSENKNEVSFYITDEMFCDNMVTEEFLIEKLFNLEDSHYVADEREAVKEIINPNSWFYSEKNVLNKPLTKESLQEAIVNVFSLLDHNDIPSVKPKALLVSTKLMFAAKELLGNGLCEYFPQNLILNRFTRSSTFAAIITDAPKSFRVFTKRPTGLSVDKRVTEIEVKISSERFFEVGNPNGIYTISF